MTIGDTILGVEESIAPPVTGRCVAGHCVIPNITPCLHDLCHTPFFQIADPARRPAFQQDSYLHTAAGRSSDGNRQRRVLKCVEAQIERLAGLGDEGCHGYIESFWSDRHRDGCRLGGAWRPQPAGAVPSCPSRQMDAPPPPQVSQVASPVRCVVIVQRLASRRIAFALPNLTLCRKQPTRVGRGGCALPAWRSVCCRTIEQYVNDLSLAIQQGDFAAIIGQTDLSVEMHALCAVVVPRAAWPLAKRTPKDLCLAGAPQPLARIQRDACCYRKACCLSACPDCPPC